jgi:hypothetical protein
MNSVISLLFISSSAGYSNHQQRFLNKRCSQDTLEANRLVRKVLFRVYLALTILAVLAIIRFSMLQNSKSIFSVGMILLILQDLQNLKKE